MRRSVGRKENTTRSKKQKLFFRFARWVQRYTTIENHDKMTDEQKRKMDAFYKPSVERLEKMTAAGEKIVGYLSVRLAKQCVVM